MFLLILNIECRCLSTPALRGLYERSAPTLGGYVLDLYKGCNGVADAVDRGEYTPSGGSLDVTFCEAGDEKEADWEENHANDGHYFDG